MKSKISRIAALVLAVYMSLCACAPATTVAVIPEEETPTSGSPFDTGSAVMNTATGAPAQGQPGMRAIANGITISVVSLNEDPKYTSTEFAQFCAGVRVTVNAPAGLKSVDVKYDYFDGKESRPNQVAHKLTTPGTTCTFELTNADFNNTIINFNWANKEGIRQDIVVTDNAGNTGTYTVYIGHYLGGRDVFNAHATCESPSTHRQTYYCQTCGRNYQTIVVPYTQEDGDSYEAPTGHNYEENGTVGHYKKYVCSKCGDVKMELNDETEEHEHTLEVDTGSSKKPTCEEDGYNILKCTDPTCGYEERQVVYATGHKASAWRVYKQGTCGTDNPTIMEQVCETCDKQLNTWTRSDLVTHQYEWVTTKQPTCTAEGEKVKRCTFCGYEDGSKQSIPKTSHQYGPETVEETQPESCKTPGVRQTVKTCAVCGDKYIVKAEAIKKEHTWGEWTPVGEIVCDKPGKMQRTCSVCGETETRNVAAQSHVAEPDDHDCTTPTLCARCGAVLTPGMAQHTFTRLSYSAKDATGHWATCVNGSCQAVKPGSFHEHINNGRKACMLPITCETCGYEIEPATAANHNFSNTWKTDDTYHWQECTNEGCPVTNRKGKHTPAPDDGDCTTPIVCSVCGIVLTEGYQAHTYQTAPAGVLRIFSAAPTVNANAPYASNAQGHWHKCDRCEQGTEIEAHVAEPDDGDCTTPVKCKVCGYIMVPAKSHKWGNITSAGAAGHTSKCTNSGCTKTSGTVAHTAKDDGDCTTAVKCSACGYVMVPAKSHKWGNATSAGAAGHTSKCTNSGCTKTSGVLAHTGKDDGNPATAVLCTACGYVITPAKAAQTGVEGFVTRLYNVCLNRNPDPSGFNNWVSRLKSGTTSGRDAAYGFFFSSEFTGKHYNDAKFVELLYQVFLNRSPDAAGRQNWVNKLSSGASRVQVLDGFAGSAEFAGLCESYGISAKSSGGSSSAASGGNSGASGSSSGSDSSSGVEGFVTRLYNVCLGRNPDPTGRQKWVTGLKNRTTTGRQAAYGFVFSQEFTGKNYSDAQFVDYMYKVFLDRNADAAGRQNWVNKLKNGSSRKDVFDGFVGSQEFMKICANYGIERG